jgi:hypothetical protein
MDDDAAGIRMVVGQTSCLCRLPDSCGLPRLARIYHNLHERAWLLESFCKRL